jgi:hypothetical protein
LEHPHESVEDLLWRSRAHRKRRYRHLDDKALLRGKLVDDKIKGKEETVWTKVARMGKLEWTELSWWIAVVSFFIFIFSIILLVSPILTISMLPYSIPRSSDQYLMTFQLFTFGSIVWVINGFIVFLPQVNSNKYAQNETGGGWTAWLGATIFEFGAIVALYEAMNRCHTSLIPVILLFDIINPNFDLIYHFPIEMTPSTLETTTALMSLKTIASML